MTTATTAVDRSTIVGIRFQKLGKTYHFRVGSVTEVQPGDYVIAETRRGEQLGQVIAFIDETDVSRRHQMRSLNRIATPRDLVMKQVYEGQELDALIRCREKAAELGVRDTKFVKAEYSFDGHWLTFYYATEDNKIDINPLRKALRDGFEARVEMQLIGPRDVAKILGGYGACGAPRCCSTFLTEFSPVSIKMAKAQGISLSPQEITGMCGRLRCCLVFEYEQYVQAKKELPRRGKRVGTPQGQGRVVDVRVMREAVMVRLDEGERKVIEVFKHELEPLDELEALQKKAEQGCSKHESGGCDCGAKK
ncbi:MAG TPA: regulatory iron-sulfur-containing complex subunit RicT [Anaerolineae bacterium]|nr:regulatory iron-sulfur-containing complex subunit RicT [Anaerolineae bacterium]